MVENVAEIALLEPLEDEARDPEVANFCLSLPNARAGVVVLALARGLTKKEAAAKAGVDKGTVQRWCNQYPIEEMALRETEALAMNGLRRLAGAMDEASAAIAAHARGEGLEDKGAAMLQQSACKFIVQTIGPVLKERQQRLREQQPATPQTMVSQAMASAAANRLAKR